MEPLLRTYGLWLRAAGYRPDTVERAERVARNYLASCNGLPWRGASQVRAFLAGAASRVKRITLLNYHKDLAFFFRFALAEGLTKNNPLQGIPKPRLSLEERERDAPMYTQTDIDALLQVCPSWLWLGLRDRAIIEMFWAMPLRVSEMVELQGGDIDWKAGEVRVRSGKGGVRYECLMSASCALALDRYLRHRPHKSQLIFLSQKGRPLTRHAVEQMLRRMAQRAGWHKPCSPHDFRHNWRARMRALGLDDTDISALMGHRSIVPTWGYGRKAARLLAKERLRLRLG